MNIKRKTLEERSEVIRLSLKYNPEKFQDYPLNGAIYLHDSLDFFEYHLQQPCDRKLKKTFLYC